MRALWLLLLGVLIGSLLESARDYRLLIALAGFAAGLLASRDVEEWLKS